MRNVYEQQQQHYERAKNFFFMKNKIIEILGKIFMNNKDIIRRVNP